MVKGRAFIDKTLASQKVKFGLVGAINTSIDFVILLALARLLGVPVVFANMLSTSCAMAVSYVLNKKTVFGNSDPNNRRQIFQFIAVTLTGLWVLQSGIIFLVTTNLSQIGNNELVLLCAKVLATIATLVWNYLWYSRVVFRKKNETNK